MASTRTPSGRIILVVYTNNADDFDLAANVITVRPDGTGSRDVTDYQSPDLRAYVGSYSPDGQWIIFRVEDHGSFGLYRARPDGSDQHAILPFSDFKPRGMDWGAAAKD